MKRIIISICLMASCTLNAEQFKITHELIKAKISYQNLNRISIIGDKIDSLVGIDTAFHFEKNEKTGEIFIRPTEENGYTPISVSVTTVSGKTQDLLLNVVDGDAKAIELVSDNSEDSSEQAFPNEYFPEMEDGTGETDYEERLSAVMKKFINQPSKYRTIPMKVPDRSHTYVTAKFQEAYRIDGFFCLKFEITTDREGVSYILDERMFSQKEDIALSLSTLRLDKNRTATLYVLRR